MSDEKPMGQVIQIDEARIRDHLGEMVRGTVEETLNAMLDAEADQLCELDVTSAARLRSRCRRDGEPRGGAGDPDDRAAGLQQARRLGRRCKPPSWESYIYSGTTGGLCGSRWGPI